MLVLSTEVISYVAHLGPSFQSVAEAYGASADVLQLLDEVMILFKMILTTISTVFSQTAIDDINEADVWNDDTFNEQNFDDTVDIDFSQVDFSYPTRADTYAVQNLSFIARAGEKIALVGRSGSGTFHLLVLFEILFIFSRYRKKHMYFLVTAFLQTILRYDQYWWSTNYRLQSSKFTTKYWCR